jgi:hypothetical protein
MKTNWASSIVLGFFLTVNCSGVAHAFQIIPNNEPAQITIDVYDYAHANPGQLVEAEWAATAILAKAGVQTVWLACPSGDARTRACLGPANPTHLVLRILPDSMSKQIKSVEGDALGFAGLEIGERLNCNAWIFYDRVKDFAARQRISSQHLLAGVIAHELGHLLLSQSAHTKAGLMHAYWSRAELFDMDCDRLFFSDAESKKIQSGVTARNQAASAILAEEASLDSQALLSQLLGSDRMR